MDERDGDSLEITSSTGSAAHVQSATTTKAGLMAAADKSKLDGVAAGAEQNVKSDWNASSGDAQILNKPMVPSDTWIRTLARGQITDANIPSSIARDTEIPQPADAVPLVAGVGAVGTSTEYAREDHRHPSEFPAGGTAGQVLKKTAGGVEWGTDLTGSGGGGATNLSITNRGASTLDLASSSGTDATVPAATRTQAGLLTGADKTKLDGVAAGAEQNVQSDWDAASGDAAILNKPTLRTDAQVESLARGQITDANIPASIARDSEIPRPATEAPEALGTAAVGTETKYAREDHVHPLPAIPQPATETPEAAGTAAVGTETKYAREDHVHASELPSGGTAGQVLKKTAGGVEWGADQTGGAGATNLSIANRGATTLDLASSSGTDATVPAASTTQAGLMTGGDKTKLDGVAAGAEQNVQSDWDAASGDAQILNKPAIPTEARIQTLARGEITDANIPAAIARDSELPQAADADPVADAATAAVGTSTEYAREDHRHPLNVDAIKDLVGQMVSGNTETGISVTYDAATHTLDFVVSGHPSAPAPTRRAAISTDSTFTESEVLAGTTSTTGSITLPTWSDGANRYIAFWQSNADGTITNIRRSGSPINVIGDFSSSSLTVSGVAGTLWRSDNVKYQGSTSGSSWVLA